MTLSLLRLHWQPRSYPSQQKCCCCCWSHPTSSVSAASSTSTVEGDHEYPLYRMLVIFGRPGAGKTTIANQVVERLLLLQQQQQTDGRHNYNNAVLGLDLDVCVSQEMRDKFSKGLYPTLQERLEFATQACDYVEREIETALLEQQQQTQPTTSSQVSDQDSTTNTTVASSFPMLSVIVSFSFVNTDLRDTYRLQFPYAEWILIDTPPEEATQRIQQRQGHFYKARQQQQQQQQHEQQQQQQQQPETTKGVTVNIDNDNSEWEFAPVTFDHIVLNGNDSIESNVDQIVQRVLDFILEPWGREFSVDKSQDNIYQPCFSSLSSRSGADSIHKQQIDTSEKESLGVQRTRA
ncbi:hypothetical protein IV203_015912 [Nitzschia inconspicua]|uniref:Uncharacterized protein n=1 Tax=Nitzschia inconspicua TaxID=303405 RepID=A0A9K3PTX7_9STRA|nr:hypothetical protein IV203_015912 [Nitzschia inconspicua]